MTPAQRAVLAKAKKDGLKPSEQASEFMLHDVVEACIQQMKNYSVAWKNLGEKEQDASIAQLTESLKETVTDAIQIIISAGASAIPFKLKKLSIDGKLTVTGLVEGDHPQRHALTDKAHDKSEILLVLSPRDYFEGLDTIKGERDQKSLPLDSEQTGTAKPDKPKAERAGKTSNVADIAAKIVFTPEQLDKAKAFVGKERVPTTAGIQNILSVGFQKAEAILAELARQGVIIQTEDGYAMPALDWDAKSEDKKPEEPSKPETAAAKKKREAAEAKADLEAKAAAAEEAPASGPTKLTDDLYELMKAKTIKDQKVSAGGLAVAFDTTIPVADEAIDRMEMEGVISDEDEMGQREVFDLPE